MRTGVVGSREATFCDFVIAWNTHVLSYPITEVVSGGAAGADSYAYLYATALKLPFSSYYPEWDKYPGKRAAYVRNQQIVDASKVLLSVWNGKSPGSKMTIGIADKAFHTGKHLLPPQVYQAAGRWSDCDLAINHLFNRLSDPDEYTPAWECAIAAIAKHVNDPYYPWVHQALTTIYSEIHP